MDFGTAVKQQPNATIEEEKAEAVDDPVKSSDQTHAGEYKNRTHNDRANDSPEQHAMLFVFGQPKIAEDQKKNEEIIGAKREFDHVPGREFERGSAALCEIENGGKRRCQGDPYPTPGERMTQARSLRMAIDDAEIEYQHGGDKYIEENPSQRLVHEQGL